MRAHNRDVESAEKPGRLQLAILEWQRQLVRAREILAEQARERRVDPPCEVHAL